MAKERFPLSDVMEKCLRGAFGNVGIIDEFGLCLLLAGL